jgi:hypothetical protein
MFRRKKVSDERQYKHEEIPAFILEYVQLPHSYHELDGTVHELMTYTHTLRINGGPLVFQRNYVAGSDKAISMIRGVARNDIRVEDAWDAKWEFNQALGRFLRGETEDS